MASSAENIWVYTPAASVTADPYPDHEESPDPFNLDRFIKAQDDNRNLYNRVLASIREGRRKPQPSTWMWFIFPQMNKCLTRDRRPNRRNRDVWPRGQALNSLDEARAYLRHPILGPRLREAAHTVLESPFTDRFNVMDNMYYDTERLHSSLTIFRQAARYPRCLHETQHHLGEDYVFRRVLDRYFVELDSSDEDEILDENNRELLKKCRGKRHSPTLTRLDDLELPAILRRLEEGGRCVCGRSREELEPCDKDSKQRIMTIPQFRERKTRAKRSMLVCPAQEPSNPLPTPASEN